MANKYSVQMSVFNEVDVHHLLSDLQLYSGNIMKITDVHGPFPGSGYVSGVIHTSMDSYNFMAMPVFCDEDSWTINLADPMKSIREGHRINLLFSFPKIHKDAKLAKRYRAANLIYQAYNNYSSTSESNRLPKYERMLGYDKLPSYNHVLTAILKDFRSFQQKRERKRISTYANN